MAPVSAGPFESESARPHRGDLPFAGQVVDLDLVVPERDQPSAIVAEHHVLHGARVGDHPGRLPRHDVPHAHGLIGAAGGDQSAIGRNGRRQHGLIVPGQRAEHVARGRIPDLQRHVLAAGHQEAAVRAERKGVDRRGVSGLQHELGSRQGRVLSHRERRRLREESHDERGVDRPAKPPGDSASVRCSHVVRPVRRTAPSRQWCASLTSLTKTSARALNVVTRRRRRPPTSGAGDAWSRRNVSRTSTSAASLISPRSRSLAHRFIASRRGWAPADQTIQSLSTPSSSSKTKPSPRSGYRHGLAAVESCRAVVAGRGREQDVHAPRAAGPSGALVEDVEMAALRAHERQTHPIAGRKDVVACHLDRLLARESLRIALKRHRVGQGPHLRARPDSVREPSPPVTWVVRPANFVTSPDRPGPGRPRARPSRRRRRASRVAAPAAAGQEVARRAATAPRPSQAGWERHPIAAAQARSSSPEARRSPEASRPTGSARRRHAARAPGRRRTAWHPPDAPPGRTPALAARSPAPLQTRWAAAAAAGRPARFAAGS